MYSNIFTAFLKPHIPLIQQFACFLLRNDNMIIVSTMHDKALMPIHNIRRLCYIHHLRHYDSHMIITVMHLHATYMIIVHTMISGTYATYLLSTL